MNRPSTISPTTVAPRASVTASTRSAHGAKDFTSVLATMVGTPTADRPAAERKPAAATDAKRPDNDRPAAEDRTESTAADGNAQAAQAALTSPAQTSPAQTSPAQTSPVQTSGTAASTEAGQHVAATATVVAVPVDGSVTAGAIVPAGNTVPAGGAVPTGGAVPAAGAVAQGAVEAAVTAAVGAPTAAGEKEISPSTFPQGDQPTADGAVVGFAQTMASPGESTVGAQAPATTGRTGVSATELAEASVPSDASAATDPAATVPADVTPQADTPSTAQPKLGPTTVPGQAHAAPTAGNHDQAPAQPAGVTAAAAADGIRPTTGVSAAAPTAPTAPAAPAAGTPTPVAQQLSLRIAPLRQGPDGVHRMTVYLHPADLGPVSVVAEIRNGTVALQLTGSTDAARETLRSALPDLRKDLQDAGFSGCQLDLRQDAPAGGQQQPRPWGVRPGASGPATADRAVHEGLSAPQVRPSTNAANRLDLHV